MLDRIVAMIRRALCGGRPCNRQSPDAEQMKYEVQKSEEPIRKESHRNRNAVSQLQGQSVEMRRQADAFASLARQIRRM